jgi:GxxExxY protein
MGTLEELEAMRPLTEKIIGCAIEVHRHIGGGLLESVYESAMCIELQDHGLAFERQPSFCIDYKGRVLGHHRADLIVERAVVVEIKSVERFDPVFDAQVLTYLRCTGLHVGLLINFRSRMLATGIRRLVL